MTNVEITPEEQEGFDRAAQIAEDALDGLLDEFSDTAENDDVDPTALIYSLWVSVTRFLLEIGWNGEELTRDVLAHERLYHGQDRPQ